MGSKQTFFIPMTISQKCFVSEICVVFVSSIHQQESSACSLTLTSLANNYIIIILYYTIIFMRSASHKARTRLLHLPSSSSDYVCFLIVFFLWIENNHIQNKMKTKGFFSCNVVVNFWYILK